ncbi:hypothetical protein FGIG_10228, partial [Fasciola gigantica]
HFDYDLLGRPVIWYWRVLQNPVLYVRRFLVESRWHIMALVISMIILVFLVLYLYDCVKSLVHFVVNFIHAKWKLNAERSEFEKHKKFLAREDPDKYAVIYCQAAASRHGVCPIFDPVPKDLPDYEAVRFVFQEPWLIDKTHRVLQKTPSTEFWGELVDGELEDAIQLATAEKRLRKRKPLPLAARIAAQQLLAKGEGPVLPKRPSLSPEMKLILGWEQLYKERVQESVEESYRWWVEQDKVLPVESQEVTRKLKPVLIKVAEEKKKKSPDGISPELFREMQETARSAFRQSVPLVRVSKADHRRSVTAGPNVVTGLKAEETEQMTHLQTGVDESQFVREIRDQEPQTAHARSPQRRSKTLRKSARSAPSGPQ